MECELWLGNRIVYFYKQNRTASGVGLDVYEFYNDDQDPAGY